MAVIRTYRSLTLLLAMLMFITSVGISMDLHYCQGQLKSTAIWSTAKSCHQVELAAHCHKGKQTSCHKKGKTTSCHLSQTEQKDCCDNTSEYYLLDIDFGAAEYADYTNVQKDFVAAFIMTYVLPFQEREASIFHFKNYKPPLLERDFPILFQSFLC